MTAKPITEPFLIKLQAAIDADPDLNVSNLAVKAGLSNSAIRQMFDQNRSPRASTMRKICAALGTTLEEFMSNAQTEEELEIVRLVSQLPGDLRRELLGYGRALASQHRKSSEQSDEAHE
jgi:transcriptional regulator with XRE-family HTH domain